MWKQRHKEEMGVMWLQVSKCQKLPANKQKLGRGKKAFASLSRLGPTDNLIQICSFQNCEMINFWHFKSPTVWNFVSVALGNNGHNSASWSHISSWMVQASYMEATAQNISLILWITIYVWNIAFKGSKQLPSKTMLHHLSNFPFLDLFSKYFRCSWNLPDKILWQCIYTGSHRGQI